MGDIPQSLLNAPTGGIRPDTTGGRARARQRSAGSKWSPVGGPAGSQRRNRRSFRDRTPGRGAIMRKSHKRIAVIAAPLTAVMVAGVAYAAWTASGNGAGYGKATTMTV